MGKCTRGQSCAFAHGQDKLRQQPDFSKTRLCADFMELGSCAEGEGCKFAHGKSELRPGSAVKIGRPSKKEMQDSPEKKDKDPAAVQGIQAEKPSSFSRQTTWEGIDTASAAFSRGTSLASAWDPLPDRTAGVPPPLPELSEWQVQVKNTFIEVSDSDTSDTEQDQGVLRRTRSVMRRMTRGKTTVIRD
ncbi:mRNA decay activator protein ZFP36 (G0/G1 switch regulatory protein 24) (Growth factor-inducible nuclear protein NUP475) (Tristetraprolin) (Zinc finger protein 36) (Zfp-36) [Durusdinium trenchii]|uniref:mRNA decay activator protein ZFP36 (G0/G1 switch regulatory protein 24) (Growth factor-inducible nuclear protein NUP475) (Tristetraprolin) (Zinc finger protein 36) (Zfp-36) n=1 Tax=Durusdinium trenchii TaxID=1381693 RepID=A0ABP0JAV6_9DINO